MLVLFHTTLGNLVASTKGGKNILENVLKRICFYSTSCDQQKGEQSKGSH